MTAEAAFGLNFSSLLMAHSHGYKLFYYEPSSMNYELQNYLSSLPCHQLKPNNALKHFRRN